MGFRVSLNSRRSVDGKGKNMNEILEVLDREDFIKNPDHFKDIVQASYNEEERYRRLKNETKEHVHKMTMFKESLLILIDKI